MKQVICKGNVRKFYPMKVYCYNSLISGIENVLKHKEIKEVWQHWRDWETETELLRDVYDGRVWKNFMSFNGVPFLSEFASIGFGLMMNIDWFQPFKIVMIILLELFILFCSIYQGTSGLDQKMLL